MLVDYTKMNGLKNDFVVFEGPLELSAGQIAALCDRQSGIGADGVLVVTPQEPDGVRMDYWNADGSPAEMCGNGLRCVARFAVDHSLAAPGTFSVQTAVGPLEVICGKDPNENIEVQVGIVKVKPNALTLQGLTFYEADVGNPHAITFVPDAGAAPVTTVGPKIEHDPHFPNRTNVEFVEVIDDQHIKLRVWERGVGETPACGTGMVASTVVCSQEKGVKLPVTVIVPGGVAQIWIDGDQYARIRGPVETTATGQTEV